MRKSGLLLVLALCVSISVMAQSYLPQGMKRQGYSLEELIPVDWMETVSAQGDINNDSISDLVVVTLPTNKEKMYTRDDGYVINMNTPVTAIYLGQPDGSLLFWSCDTLLIPNSDEYFHVDMTVEIKPTGVFHVGYQDFSSAGTATNGNYRFVYRFQQGDFYCIGMETREYNRYTGESRVDSYNYMTHKKQALVRNEDNKVVRNEFEDLLKEPLQKFGE